MSQSSSKNSLIVRWNDLFALYQNEPDTVSYQFYVRASTEQWQQGVIDTLPNQFENELLGQLEAASHQVSYPLVSSLLISCEQSQWLATPAWVPTGELLGLIACNVTGLTNETHNIVLRNCDLLASKISYDLVSTPQDTERYPSLQEFINSLDDHAWIKSPSGKYIMCNESVGKAWGIATRDVIGKYDPELFSPELANKFLAADKRVIESKKQFVVEECCSSNDDNLWLETIKSPIFDGNNTLIGVLGMTRNVTRRKVVENQLKLASKIFNNSQEGMFITDCDGNIIEINQAFTTITGYHSDQVVGRNPKLLQSGYHSAEFYRDMWHKLTTTGQWKGEFINRRKDGSIYPQIATISSVEDQLQNPVNYICVFEDISQQREHEEKLKKMAFFDPLTDLPNRTHLASLLGAQIQQGDPFATLFLDIDHFKHINDSLGHFSGDQVLIELARRLKTSLRRHDHVARIGGDEFVVILTDITPTDLPAITKKLLGLFEQPFSAAETQSLRLSTSIGLAIYPNDGTDSESLLRNADTAMYKAKKNGRNGYAFYSPELTNLSISHLKIHSALHEAIEKHQLHLCYQPQFELSTHTLIGFEALLRWSHPELGNVSPIEFIPIAEKSGLMNTIGHWVIEQACLQGKMWIDKGYDFGRIAVNISTSQLQKKGFSSTLREILQSTQFPAQHLELEVTEGFLMRDPKEAARQLNELKEIGIEIALDDFGTGFSSLSYLKGLPLDKLKIDRSFINDVSEATDSQAIVNAIIAMAQSLSLKVIAEGIETEQQKRYLIERGCNLGQGFLLGRPEITSTQEALLKSIKQSNT